MYKRGITVNVAIEIPDDIGRLLAAQAGDLLRAVLEAVAVEAYRSGAITPAQVQQMLGLRSRWQTIFRSPLRQTPLNQLPQETRSSDLPVSWSDLLLMSSSAHSAGHVRLCQQQFGNI